jgi:hypothetical protein
MKNPAAFSHSTETSQAAARATSRTRLTAALLLLLILLAGLWNLAGPPMWWDEGWTLSVARNWVELGHYGRLQLGEPAPPGLEAAFPVTAGVALGMQLFGVGLWQGRLFGVLCTALALLLLAMLAQRLYDRRIALASLAVALLLTMHPQIHPLLQGRQVLGEIPMFAALLGGLLCLSLALERRVAWLLPASALLGLAWITKAQTAPFLLTALGVPTLVALFFRRRRVALLFGLALLGSYLMRRLYSWGIGMYLQDRSLPGEPVSGLLSVVALVLTPANRLLALNNLLIFGLPTLLGLLYALWLLWRDRGPAATGDGRWYIRLALLALAGSWLAWFALLSVGVPRYLAPPVFLGTIFVAVLLRDLTAGFDIVAGLNRLSALLSRRSVTRDGFAALLALLLFIGPLALTTLAFQRYYFVDDQSAQRVAAYFNAMPANSVLIETYESELHFLLDQPYHFPPDQTHVELNRRSLLNEQIEISYNPLAADPDYLVVGEFARGNQLYAPVIEAGIFRLLLQEGGYLVYERVP